MLVLYTRLMRLYPPSFRARFGDEMLQLVRDEATHGPRVPWLRTYADLFRSASVRRWEEKDMRSRWWIVPVGIFFAFLVARVVVGASFGPRLFLVTLAELGLASLILIAVTLIARSTRGAEHDYVERRFHWWWVPAGMVGGTEVVLAVRQLVVLPKFTNVAAMLAIGSLAALVFGGMAIRNRQAGNWMIAAGVSPALGLFWMIVPAIVAFLVIVSALADNVTMGRAQPAI